MTNLFFDNLDNRLWDDLPWQDIRIHVSKIQTQIYRKAYEHEEVSLRKLQYILLQDYSARLLSLYTVVNYQFIKKKLGLLIFLYLTLKQAYWKLVKLVLLVLSPI
nr:hypothetical protein [Erythrotrichia welwitschii]